MLMVSRGAGGRSAKYNELPDRPTVGQLAPTPQRSPSSRKVSFVCLDPGNILTCSAVQSTPPTHRRPLSASAHRAKMVSRFWVQIWYQRVVMLSSCTATRRSTVRRREASIHVRQAVAML